MAVMTPEQLVELFRRSTGYESVPQCIKVLDEFKEYENKKGFLEPIIRFLDTEDQDKARAWGATALQEIGGTRAYKHLAKIITPRHTKDVKRKFLYTRFFALKGLYNLAATSAQKEEVIKLCKRVYPDDDEDFLVRAEAAVILAMNGDLKALSWLKDMLKVRKDHYWEIIRTARALFEFPLSELTTHLIEVLRNKDANIDHRWQIVRALGNYRGSEVVQELSKVARESQYSFMREEAISSLG